MPGSSCVRSACRSLRISCAGSELRLMTGADKSMRLTWLSACHRRDRELVLLVLDCAGGALTTSSDAASSVVTRVLSAIWSRDHTPQSAPGPGRSCPFTRLFLHELVIEGCENWGAEAACRPSRAVEQSRSGLVALAVQRLQPFSEEALDPVEALIQLFAAQISSGRVRTQPLKHLVFG